MDYAVEQCLDDDNNQRCSKPFLVTKATCYDLSWTTDGAISHTTAEVRDAGSNEIVYYRDTDGEWTPEKGEVSCYCRWARASLQSCSRFGSAARLPRLQAQGLGSGQQDCGLHCEDMCLKAVRR
jgi:hypothetical protein